MYRSFTAEEYKKHMGLPSNYSVDGLIVFGTFRRTPYQLLKQVLNDSSLEVSYQRTLSHDFFDPIMEFQINKHNYWFTIAYGGAMLSEWLHQACLYGSQNNIVIGSCGGLFEQANANDIVVPSFASANESTTRMYEPEANGQHYASQSLNQQLISKLNDDYKTWLGPTVTCQAMMAETYEDIKQWSSEGYFGVEMEAATVFAVSNYFKREAAALLVIGDNLIANKTVLDVNYEEGASKRQSIRQAMLSAAISTLVEKQ